MQDFKELKVWQKAHIVVLNSYQMTALFPKDELFGLVSQIRRAAVSVAANIVEGCSRDNEGDFKRFLQMAQASAAELEYEMLLARDLRYLTDEQYAGTAMQIQEVRRMLNGFIQTLRASNSSSKANG